MPSVTTALPKPDALRAPKGISAAELMRTEMPQIRALYAPWLYEGVTLLAGAPKSGKTTLSRQLTEAVGGGGAFLESAGSGEPAHVAFISLEEGERLFRRKLEIMKIDYMSSVPITLFFEWGRGLIGCAQLNDWLTRTPNTRLVVIDSLSRFRQPTDKNVTQFQADYDAITGLQNVAKQNPGVAILVIHHTRKMRSVDAMDDISGTYGLTAAADAFLVLRKEGAGGTLHCGGRLWDRDECDFELTRADQRWHLKGVSDGLTDGERFTLKVITDAGGMGPTELAKALGLENRQAAYSRINALMAKGKLEKRGHVYHSAY